jgi:hypothetical protein
MHRYALRFAHALHRPAQAERVCSRDLNRTDIEDAPPRGWQAVCTQGLFVAPPARKVSAHGDVSELLVERQGSDRPSREIGCMDKSDRRGTLHDLRGLHGADDRQAGAPEDVT